MGKSKKRKKAPDAETTASGVNFMQLQHAEGL